MQLNSVSHIERISILTKLVLTYCENIDFLNAIVLAKDLASVIDELTFYKIDINKLSKEFFMFFPEHWKKRTQFLLIIKEHWPNILMELNKKDIEPEIDNSIYFSPKYHCKTNKLSENFEVTDIKNRIVLLETETRLQEISYIIDVILKNPKNNIAIVATDADFYEILVARLEIEDIPHTSFVETFNRNQEDTEFSNEIIKYFDYYGDSFFDNQEKVEAELRRYLYHEKTPRQISIIKISDIKYCFDDLIILSSLNEDSWKTKYPGKYWLHPSVRKNLKMIYNNINEDNFYSAFNGYSDILLTRAKNISGVNTYKSSILTKFEAKCEKHKIAIENETAEYKVTTHEQKKDLSFIDNFNEPEEINSSSVDLLENYPYAFYVKELLKIEPETDLFHKNISTCYKKLMIAYHSNQEDLPYILEEARNIDYFYFQKFKNVLEWLFKNEKIAENSLFNIKGKATVFNDFKTAIFTRADQIIKNNETSVLVEYKLNNNDSDKKIKEKLIIKALIAEQEGFGQDVLPIREIQVVSLNTDEKEHIKKEHIQVSKEDIEEYKTKLHNLFEICFVKKDVEYLIINNKSNFDKYKHFERK